jgi:hypothetical protein
MIYLAGDVAQLGERDNRTVEVRGSSPLISTATSTTYFYLALQIANEYGIISSEIEITGVVGLLDAESSRVVRGCNTRPNSPVVSQA